jgi:hypothetical protein
MADTELEELQELIESPGWRRLVAHAENTYGPSFLAVTARRLADGEETPTEVGQKLRYAAHAMKAVGLVLGWPQERVSRLVKP